MKPLLKPNNPHFCSGPCAKIPGWNLNVLSNAMTARSHRSKEGQSSIKYMLDQTKKILEIPDDYKIALVPGSATGAITMAIWNFLGQRDIDSLVWDVFGQRWTNDIQSLIHNVSIHIHSRSLGQMLDFHQVDFHRDLFFVWNATSTGSSIGDIDWYTPKDGLVICDATSEAFCVKLPWHKLDVTCFSWQKGMGGEGAHGLIVISPKAMERLRNYTPEWSIPYMINLKNNHQIRTELFEGVAINTPSMLCLEDYLQSLAWAERNGGLSFLTERSEKNYQLINQWIENRSWIKPLMPEKKYRSKANTCLQILKENLPIDDQGILKITDILSKENVAFDIKGFAGTPSNLRIWTGPTVESDDLQLLCNWIDWIYNEYIA